MQSQFVKYNNPSYRHSYFCKQKWSARVSLQNKILEFRLLIWLTFLRLDTKMGNQETIKSNSLTPVNGRGLIQFHHPLYSGMYEVPVTISYPV